MLQPNCTYSTSTILIKLKLGARVIEYLSSDNNIKYELCIS